MAVLPRLALPIAHFVTTVKRIHLPQPVMLLSLKQFSHRRYVLPPESSRRKFVRSMATGEENEAVVPASVSVLVAHELLLAGHRYLDVRTVAEFNAGHVVGATNIPFMLNAESVETLKNSSKVDISLFEGSTTRTPDSNIRAARGVKDNLVNVIHLFHTKGQLGMTKNLNFLDEVSKTFGKDDEILIGCLFGKRSFLAASELSSVGFTSLTNVAGGYASWVQNNLPIES